MRKCRTGRKERFVLNCCEKCQFFFCCIHICVKICKIQECTNKCTILTIYSFYQVGRFSPFLYATQTLRMSRGIALLFSRTFGTRWEWGVSPTPQPPLPRERPGTNCTGGWVSFYHNNAKTPTRFEPFLWVIFRECTLAFV
jgi:hypothetical protein